MMKKFKSFMMIAAAVLIGFSSCNNDPIDGPDGPDGPTVPEGASIQLTFNVSGGTRAIGDSQGNNVVRVDGGIILLTNASDNIVAARAISGAITGNTTETFLNMPAAVSRAHFVGNTDIVAALGGVTAVEDLVDRNLSEVRNHLLTVQSQRQILTGTEAENPTHNFVNVWGTSGTFTQQSEATATANAVYTAAVNVNPTVARVEIFNITGNSYISDFRVRGIFVDSFYTQGRVGFGGANWRAIGDGGAGSGALFAHGTVNFPDNAENLGVIHDWAGDTGWLPFTVPNNSPEVDARGLRRVVAPGTDNNVWGYNLFAGTGEFVLNPAAGQPGHIAGSPQHLIGGTRTPRIAIRLDNVIVRETISTISATAPAGTLPTVHGTVTAPFAGQGGSLRVLNSAWDFYDAGDIDEDALEDAIRDIWAIFEDDQHADYGDADVRDAAILALFADQWLPADNTTTFISIRGFLLGNEPLDAQNRPIPNLTTGFIPRMVYQFGSYTGAPGDTGSSWTFGPDDLDEIPFRRDIDLNVEVTILPWHQVSVTPAL